MATRVNKCFFLCLITFMLFITENELKAKALDLLKDSSMLIGEFQSYLSIETVQEYLNDLLKTNSSWDVSNVSNEFKFDLDNKCIIKEYFQGVYWHLGFKGNLKFVFIDNQLVETSFFPEDFQGYKNVLVKTYSLILKEGEYSNNDWKYQEARYSTNTLITISDNQKVSKYAKSGVFWKDLRLQKRVDFCLSKE